jgi:hypothetical protein
MAKSEIMNAAHAEARKIVAQKGYTYREAMKFGLRRVYNKIQNDASVARILAQPKTPKFMFLRGL